MKASGQLEQLAASFARLDPPPWGTRREVANPRLVDWVRRQAGGARLTAAVCTGWSGSRKSTVIQSTPWLCTAPMPTSW